MILNIVKVHRNQKSKKGYSIQIEVGTGFGDLGDTDILNFFSRTKQNLKPNQKINVNPATDANFFFPEKSNSSSIGDLLK